VVPLGNPLSEEAGVLRPSLVPGMLAMIAGNLHRDVSDVRLFELGTVFSGTTNGQSGGAAGAGVWRGGQLAGAGAAARGAGHRFHDVKGVVEQVLARFQARAVYFDRFPAEAGMTPEWLHPYRAARAWLWTA
jgi:phenylalanyl-tRNA synthetase beta chain